MEASKLDLGYHSDVHLDVVGGRRPRELRRPAEVLLSQEVPGEPRLTFWPERTSPRSRELEVRGKRASDRDRLESLLAQGRGRVCWVAAATNREIAVHVHIFDDHDRFVAPLRIGVDERVQDYVRRAMDAPHASMERVEDWLVAEFLLPSITTDGARRFVASRLSRHSDRVIGFSIHGRHFVLDVDHHDDGRMLASRMTKQRPDTDQLALVLCSAQVEFDDFRAATRNREEVKIQLGRLCARNRLYLDLWATYSELTRADLLNRARTLGFARYDSCEVLSTGAWRFQLASDNGSRPFLRRVTDEIDGGGIEIEASVEVPDVVLGGDLADGARSSGRRARDRSISGMAKHPDLVARTIELAPGQTGAREIKPPPQGRLYYAVSGQLTRLKRREAAFERIKQGEAKMPGLALLLLGLPTTERRPSRHHAALSPATRALFGKAPTKAQRRALEIALNTPDIALIQGPPGTGKTLLIAALQQRLLEIGESVQVHTQTLLTSEQHVAVDNVAERIRVRGLPPNRVDPRPRRGPTGSTEQWRRQAIRAVRDEIEGRNESERWGRARRLQQVVAGYVVTPPTPDRLVEMLAEVEELSAGLVPFALREQLVDERFRLGDRLATRIGHDRMANRWLVPLVRALRCTPTSFSDDGARTARVLLDRAPGPLLGADDSDVLASAASVTSGAPERLLTSLSGLRDRLLDGLVPQIGPPAPPGVDPLLRELLEEIAIAAMAAVRTSSDGIDVALAEYLAELEEDPDRVQRTIAGYTPVHAATCQHADSRSMRVALPEMAFDTVIVDEAARVNPLDLMIPLSLGQSRLVLVGDHAQLPHVLDRAIEDAMLELDGDIGEGDLSANLELLRTSLFEWLYEQFAPLSSPQRAIRLDAQFRMHPTLGKFVSDNFYETNGEPPIESLTDASERRHGLRSYGDDVAVWLDVGSDRGGDERVRRSWRRQEEAKRIARELKALTSQGGDLSFGVITFYSAQVRCLWDELALVDLAVQVNEGDFEPAANLGRTPDGKERLQVGTVDAFQGREFDVVLLSVVRSTGGDPINRVEPWRSYGHLTMANRLCVAMSRARRLLITVGDAGMFRREVAAPEVDPLTRFLEMCRPPHGRLVP